MSDAFAKLIGSLFGKFGLILLDSADPELRKLEKPFFAKLIERNGELEAAYKQSAMRIVDGGYELQADVTSGNANLSIYMKVRGCCCIRRMGDILTARVPSPSHRRNCWQCLKTILNGSATMC